MATLTFDQKKNVILKNPNKDLVTKAQADRIKLMMHLHGVNLKDAMKREDYFENADIYKTRTEAPTSNKDLFSRILNQEEMVFSARGGSVHFGLQEKDENKMLALLTNVRYGISLRDWVKNFALSAYRADPMGLIFMETDELFTSTNPQDPDSDYQVTTPKCYPTYKSSKGVFDYNPNGRSLEYVCFRLTRKDLTTFGVVDEDWVQLPEVGKQPSMSEETPYYRFVDDAEDVILKQVDMNVILAPKMKQQNPMPHNWKTVPALLASDLIHFEHPGCFASPVHYLVELADTFLYDRSIRDLQKKYHGFAKAIEPMLKCPSCNGTGQAKGSACPDCTPAGQNKGTGFKLKTKISDVAKFPLEILEKTSFDFRKIFGYVAPEIATWTKQDESVMSQEDLMYYTYWGTRRDMPAQGPSKGQNLEETATKTLANLQPKYARLNATADWAEKTETAIADFIGVFWFSEKFKGSQIAYGRDYILETAQDLIDAYYDARDNGASDVLLDEMYARYLRCTFQNQPNELAKYMKLLAVEPFPHLTKDDIKTLSPVPEDFYSELYFREFVLTLTDSEIISTEVPALQAQLKAFVVAKAIPPPILPGQTMGPDGKPLPPVQAEAQGAAAGAQHGKGEVQEAVDQA